MTQFEMKDISSQTYGKYQFCTKAKDGMWYADSDFEHPGGFGNPMRGALPAPHQDTPELIAKAKAMHEASARRAVSSVLGGRQRPARQPPVQISQPVPAHVIWIAVAIAAFYVCAIVAIWRS